MARAPSLAGEFTQPQVEEIKTTSGIPPSYLFVNSSTLLIRHVNGNSDGNDPINGPYKGKPKKK